MSELAAWPAPHCPLAQFRTFESVETIRHYLHNANADSEEYLAALHATTPDVTDPANRRLLHQLEGQFKSFDHLTGYTACRSILDTPETAVNPAALATLVASANDLLSLLRSQPELTA